jgi:hypothetical protein
VLPTDLDGLDGRTWHLMLDQLAREQEARRDG